MLNQLRRQFAYDAWANQETLRSLQKTPAPKALRYFGHILAAELLWHGRLQGQSTKGFAVWPAWTRDQCEVELSGVSKIWEAYLAKLPPERLELSISYSNTKGESWQNTVSDILTHVIIHSAYHRGQIATDIRAAGGEPAYTDYIHAVRQGFIEESISRAHGH